MPNLDADARLVAENVKLQQQLRQAYAREMKDNARIRELEGLVKHYRAKAKEGYAKRRSANEMIRAVWIGAVVSVGAQVVGYAMFEIWQWIHGISI